MYQKKFTVDKSLLNSNFRNVCENFMHVSIVLCLLVYLSAKLKKYINYFPYKD